MLKKTLMSLAIGGALLGAGQMASAEDYKIDTTHAFVLFKISHIGFSWEYGSFKKLDGSVSYDGKSPEASKVSVTIQTDSVDTNMAERDKHLRSADFLDVDKFPTATFESTEVKSTGKDTADVTGNLTLHGVTKPVTIHAKLLGEGKDPWGNQRLGFEGSTTLKLKDYAIKYDLGPAAQDVEMIISFDAIHK